MMNKTIFLKEFYDEDDVGNVYSFRGLSHSCTAAYYLHYGNNGPEVKPVSSCEISAEFDGVNHKTSHDGLLKVKSEGISEDILAEIGGIRVTLGGSYITRGKEEQAVTNV